MYLVRNPQLGVRNALHDVRIPLQGDNFVVRKNWFNFSLFVTEFWHEISNSPLRREKPESLGQCIII